jgi:hypothetical protein
MKTSLLLRIVTLPAIIPLNTGIANASQSIQEDSNHLVALAPYDLETLTVTDLWQVPVTVIQTADLPQTRRLHETLQRQRGLGKSSTTRNSIFRAITLCNIA